MCRDARAAGFSVASRNAAPAPGTSAHTSS